MSNLQSLGCLIAFGGAILFAHYLLLLPAGAVAFTSPSSQYSKRSLLLNRISPRNHHHHSHHTIEHHYSYKRIALNLVPFSEAWEQSPSSTSSSSSSTFSSLLPKLGCRSLNSEGMIIHKTNINDENKRYRLYIATDVDDLPPIAQLTIDVFDATAITLSTTSDWSEIEKLMVNTFVEPAIGMYNAYAQAVGYTEVLSGLRKRMRNRIIVDNMDNNWLAPLIVNNESSSSNEVGTKTTTTTLEDVAARSSLILSLARHNEGDGDDNNMEVVASVELRLQPTDAKIPFSQPWLDKLERKLVQLVPSFVKDEDGSTLPTSNNPPLRPYLCNLCVSPTLRSMGIGRALCRIVEYVAKDKWGYNHMYLHVDPTNDAARGLYEKEGYVDVGRRWNVLWAGGANDISYYVKKL